MKNRSNIEKLTFNRWTLQKWDGRVEDANQLSIWELNTVLYPVHVFANALQFTRTLQVFREEDYPACHSIAHGECKAIFPESKHKRQTHQYNVSMKIELFVVERNYYFEKVLLTEWGPLRSLSTTSAFPVLQSICNSSPLVNEWTSIPFWAFCSCCKHSIVARKLTVQKEVTRTEFSSYSMQELTWVDLRRTGTYLKL